MAIIQPTDFANLLARAPRLNEYGTPFQDAVRTNAQIGANLVGLAMESDAALALEKQRGESLIAAEKQRGKSLVKAEKARRGGDDKLAKLAAVAPILAGSGGLLSSNRFAGDALAGLLATPTPQDVLGNFNDTLSGLNTSRALIEPWGQTGQDYVNAGIRRGAALQSQSGAS